jgi:hypothetical protein
MASFWMEAVGVATLKTLRKSIENEIDSRETLSLFVLAFLLSIAPDFLYS